MCRCVKIPMTFRILCSMSTKVKCQGGFELTGYGLLFAPIHTLALISDRLATKINMPLTVVSENG